MASCPGCWLSSALQGGGHPSSLGGYSPHLPMQLMPCPPPQSALLALTAASPPCPAEHGLRRSRGWCPQRSWLGMCLGPSGSWSCWRSWGNKSRGTAVKSPGCTAGRAAASGQWPLHVPGGTSTEMGLGLSWAHSPVTQGLGTLSRSTRPGRGRREGGRDGEGAGLTVFPRHLCWVLQPCPTPWLCLSISPPVPRPRR